MRVAAIVQVCIGDWLCQIHGTHPLHLPLPRHLGQIHGTHPLYLPLTVPYVCTYAFLFALFAGPRVFVLTALISRTRGTKTGPWPGLFAFGTQSGQCNQFLISSATRKCCRPLIIATWAIGPGARSWYDLA